MQLTVRRAERSDLPVLAALCNEHAQFEGGSALQHGLAEKLGDALFGKLPKAVAWVAVGGGDVLGFATASSVFCTWQVRDFLHLDCLYLAEGARGRGGGKALLSAVCAYAAACEFAWLEWQTPAWNKSAIKFYRRLGAREMAKRRFVLEVKNNCLTAVIR